MSFLPTCASTASAAGAADSTPRRWPSKFRGKSIGDVLTMTVDEAVAFFAAQPKIHHPLTLLRDVGLGYLALGQPSPTLSGGEAQRVKLVTELAKVRPEGLRARPSAPTLYVLDEPTIGLHIADVEKLVLVLHRLVDAGNSVIVIEHNLDVLAEADWLVDLGPEGGSRGRPRRCAGAARESGPRPLAHGARAAAVSRSTRLDGNHTRVQRKNATADSKFCGPSKAAAARRACASRHACRPIGKAWMLQLSLDSVRCLARKGREERHEENLA